MSDSDQTPLLLHPARLLVKQTHFLLPDPFGNAPAFLDCSVRGRDPMQDRERICPRQKDGALRKDI